METVVLYRPVSWQELELIKQSDWKRFPPRLPEQPIFYPVLNERYADQINREWNVPAYGSGFTTKFHIDAAYIVRFTVQNVGGEDHNELWIPAEELEEFNDHIVGNIEVVREFNRENQ